MILFSKELSNLLDWIYLPHWLSFNLVIEHRCLFHVVIKNGRAFLIIFFVSSVRSLRNQLMRFLLQKCALFRFALLLSTRPTGVGQHLVVNF